MLIALSGLVVVLALAVAVLVTWGTLRAGRDVLDPSPHELFIVAPHPDDCVILAGELGDQVLELGGTVRIAYVTLGGAGRDDPRYITRKRESERAWQHRHRGQVLFHWLGLPQSETVAGPLAAAPNAQAKAAAALAELLTKLTPLAVVVIPAHLEEHVDHRLSRTLALDALERAARSDLLVLESDTYNDVVSLLTSPKKALFRVLGALPITVRTVMNRAVDPGGPTSPELLGVSGLSRLDSKRARLSAHRSQDERLLVRAFGRPDRFHRLDPRRAPRGQRLTQPGFVHVQDILVDGSTLLLWLLVSATSALAAALPLSLIERLLGHPFYFPLAAAFLVLSLLFATRRQSPERLAVALGLLLGTGLVGLQNV